MRHTLADLPLNPIVGSLRLDVGAELPGDAPDLHRERHSALVLLSRALDPMHELRPLLELRPLVVDRLEWKRDLDALLHRHTTALARPRCPILAIAAPAAERQRAFGRFLQHPARPARFVDLVLDLLLDARTGTVTQVRRRAAEGISRRLD